jgi:hypothetical protein
LNKLPYQIVVGDKEMAANLVAVRTRGGQDLGQMPLEALIERLLERSRGAKWHGLIFVRQGAEPSHCKRRNALTKRSTHLKFDWSAKKVRRLGS